MPGPRKKYTTPHRCMTVDSLRINQPSDRDRQAGQKLQEKTSDFHTNFYIQYNTFDHDKPFNIHLDPPSTEWPPLDEIKQERKASI